MESFRRAGTTWAGFLTLALVAGGASLFFDGAADSRLEAACRDLETIAGEVSQQVEGDALFPVAPEGEETPAPDPTGTLTALRAAIDGQDLGSPLRVLRLREGSQEQVSAASGRGLQDALRALYRHAARDSAMAEDAPAEAGGWHP